MKMFAYIFYTLCIFAFSFNPIKAQQMMSPNAENFYKQAIVFHDSQKLTEAVEYYTQALVLDDSYTKALYNRGLAYYQMGKLNKAASDFDQLIALNPNDKDAYEMRGSIRHLLDDPEGALKDYSVAINNGATNTLLTNRAMVYAEMDEHELALQDIDKALEINPNDKDAHGYKGDVLLARGNYSEAIQEYDKNLTADHVDGQTIVNRANALEELGLHEEALNDLDKVSEQLEDSHVFLAKAKNLIAQNKYEEAIEAAVMASKLDYQSEESYYIAGLAQLKMEQYYPAQVNLEKVVELNPKNNTAYYYKGMSLHQQELYHDAIASFDRAISLGLNHSEIYTWRGFSKFMHGQYSAALKDQKQALQLDPSNSIAYHRMNECFSAITNEEYARMNAEGKMSSDVEDTGEAYFGEPEITASKEIKTQRPVLDYHQSEDLKRALFLNKAEAYQEALVELDQVLHLEEDNYWAYNARGIAYEGLNNSESAIADFSVAIELEPAFAEAYYNRANAHYDSRDYANAIRDLDQVINLDPNMMANANFMRGQCWVQLKEPDAAILDFNTCLHFNPAHIEALNNRGALRQIKKDYEGAMEDFNTAIMLAPSTLLYVNRANLAIETSDFESARRDYAAALKFDPNNRGIQYRMALTLYAMKDYEESLLSYDQLLKDERNQGNSEYYFNRGLVHHKMGNANMAIGDYSLAIQMDPTHKEAYYNRGHAKKLLKDWAGAEKDLMMANQYGFKPVNDGVLTTSKQ